jgi:hypothetical protein
VCCRAVKGLNCGSSLCETLGAPFLQIRHTPMIKHLLLSILRYVGFPRKASSPTRKRIAHYSLESFDNRSAAREAVKQDGIAALVGAADKPKWLILKCPCGCGQEIALNLMGSHLPRWHVDIKSARRFSVHPSVDATSCGAHFWLRNGQVIWCD